jgi:hypothetical protein
MKYLEPLEASNIKDFLIAGFKKRGNSDGLSKFVVSYETFIKAMLLFCNNSILKVTLERI